MENSARGTGSMEKMGHFKEMGHVSMEMIKTKNRLSKNEKIYFFRAYHI